MREPSTFSLPEPLILIVSGAAIYQLYLPLGGTVHVTLWLAVACLYPAVSLLAGLPLRRSLSTPAFAGLVIILLSFAAAMLVSSDPVLGAKMIVWLLAATAGYLIGFHFGGRGKAHSLLRGLVLCMSPVAFVNIIFFAVNSLEEMLFTSPIARFLLEPDTLAQLNQPRFGFNALHPLKAGTFFVNANVASIFFGLGLCFSIFLWGRQRSRRGPLLVSLFFFAFLSTGSRAGLLAALTTALAVIAVLGLRGSVRRVVATSAVAVFALVLAYLLPFSRFAVERIVGLSANIDPRWLIWYHAAEILSQNPISGVGFGGWQYTFPAFARNFGLDPTLPPHNAFLIAWLWAGIVGLVGMLILFVGSLYTFVRQSRHPEARDLAVLGCASVVWVAVQLMFTNFALVEPRIGAVFFLSIGTAMGGILWERTLSGKARSGLQKPYPSRVRGVAVPSAALDGSI